MERACFIMTVLPGREEEYERRHREIWDEMVAELRRSGITNYSLFRRGRTVIAYAECIPDATTAFGIMGATDVNKRWSEWFGDVLEEFTDAEGQLLWASEVWHLA